MTSAAVWIAAGHLRTEKFIMIRTLLGSSKHLVSWSTSIVWHFLLTPCSTCTTLAHHLLGDLSSLGLGSHLVMTWHTGDTHNERLCAQLSSSRTDHFAWFVLDGTCRKKHNHIHANALGLLFTVFWHLSTPGLLGFFLVYFFAAGSRDTGDFETSVRAACPCRLSVSGTTWILLCGKRYFVIECFVLTHLVVVSSVCGTPSCDQMHKVLTAGNPHLVFLSSFSSVWKRVVGSGLGRVFRR